MIYFSQEFKSEFPLLSEFLLPYSSLLLAGAQHLHHGDSLSVRVSRGKFSHFPRSHVGQARHRSLSRLRSITFLSERNSAIVLHC